MIRRLAKILAALFVLIALVLGGFRVASMLRENQSPEEAAGPAALFADAGGLTMHYKTWGPADGQVVMLVHGTLSWAGTWADIAEPLAAKGYRVIAPDMPPFGFSEKAPDGDYSRPASARRLLAFADALGLESFVLGVHSYGGGLALEAAFTQPERIRGLILFDVALCLQREQPNAPPAAALLGIGPIRNAIMAATFANPMMIGYGLRSFVYDDEIIDDARIALYAAPRHVAGTTDAVGHWFVNGLFGEPAGNLSDDLTNYKAFAEPVLVIWGEEDTVTPLSQGRFIAKAFPNARLEILPEVDHIPQIENPAYVLRKIEPFLQDLPKVVEMRPDPQPVSAMPAVAAQPPEPLPLRGTLD